jgi:hypothetical protein
MLKFDVYSELLKHQICRILFLLFLSCFAIYPILDAFADSLNSSLVENNIDDDSVGDDNAFHVFKDPSQNYHATGIVLFHQTSTTCHPVLHNFDRLIAFVVKTIQTCPTSSSDPSPPLS